MAFSRSKSDRFNKHRISVLQFSCDTLRTFEQLVVDCVCAIELKYNMVIENMLHHLNDILRFRFCECYRGQCTEHLSQMGELRHLQHLQKQQICKSNCWHVDPRLQIAHSRNTLI